MSSSTTTIQPQSKEERIKFLKDSFMKAIQNSPKYKYESENKAQIVTFENSLYLRGGLYMCITDFCESLNSCYLWCKKTKDCNTIYFFINSSGGEKRVKNTCVKRMQLFKNRYQKYNIRIECIVIQYCCSAAVELALECDTVKVYKNAKMGIHYIQNIKYEFKNENDNLSSIKQVNSERVLLEENKECIENYYESKLKLDTSLVKRLLTESKLLNTEEILQYNLATEVIDILPQQFNELRKQIK
jgi:ATP-dependent protease ClpP protease subunit